MAQGGLSAQRVGFVSPGKLRHSFLFTLKFLMIVDSMVDVVITMVVGINTTVVAIMAGISTGLRNRSYGRRTEA